MREKSVKCIIPLLITLIYATFVYAMADGVIYAINDDRYMSQIVSGIVSGSPNGHALYMNYAFTYLLSRIYTIIPGIDWYGISMQIFMWIAFFAFLYRVVNRKKVFEKIIGVSTLLFLWQIVFIKYVLMFEFTLVPAVTGGALLFWCITMENEPEEFDKCVDQGLLVLLGIITFCVRKNVFYMLLPFLLIVFVYRFVTYKTKYGLMSIVILTGVIIGVTAIHKSAYSVDEWVQFKAYNSARSYIYDFSGLPEYDANESFYTELGVSYEEYVCLKQYAVGLDYPAGIKVILEEVGEYADIIRDEAPMLELRENVSSFFDKFKDNFLRNLMDAFLVICSITFALVLKKKKQRETIAAFVTIVAMITECVYLIYLGRFPIRVISGVILLGISTILGFLHQVIDIEKKGRISKLVIPFLAVVTCFLCVWCISVWGLVQEKKSSIETATKEYEDLMQYCRNNPENFYVSLGGDFGASTKVLRIRENQTGLNYTGIAGWSIHMPCENEKFKRYGIESIEKAMLFQDNVYVMHGSSGRVEAVKMYLDKKYGSVMWNLKDTFELDGEQYNVFKLSVSN